MNNGIIHITKDIHDIKKLVSPTLRMSFMTQLRKTMEWYEKWYNPYNKGFEGMSTAQRKFMTCRDWLSPHWGCLQRNIPQDNTMKWLFITWSFGWSLEAQDCPRSYFFARFGVQILRHQTKLLSLDLDTHIAAPVVTQSDLSQQRKRRRVQVEHTGDNPLQDVHDFVLHYVDSPRFY